MKTPGELRRLIASKAGFPPTTATSSQTGTIAPTPDTSGLPTFTPFPRLPIELRAAIWRFALSCNPYITELLIYNKSIAPHLTSHTVFAVNRESRTEAFAALLGAPPPYSLPADPDKDIISLNPMLWNDLPHMSVGKVPIRAAVSDVERAQRFVAAALVDSEGGQFSSVAVDMRFYSPYGHTVMSAGPRDFLGRPLKMEFFRVARKVETGSAGLGGGFYVNCVDGEELVVGLGGRKGQGPRKPVLRVVYVL